MPQTDERALNQTSYKIISFKPSEPLYRSVDIDIRLINSITAITASPHIFNEVDEFKSRDWACLKIRSIKHSDTPFC